MEIGLEMKVGDWVDLVNEKEKWVNFGNFLFWFESS
jgi:hypothetical protein